MPEIYFPVIFCIIGTVTQTQELIQHLRTLSYGGVFIASLLANVVVPVPEEVVLLAIGYVARSAGWSLFIIFPLVMAGLLASDLVLYYFSKKGNRLIMAFYNRIFKSRLDDRRHWLEKNVNKVIFFSRFLVQLRFLGPFFAGQTKVTWKVFIGYELLAMLIYVPLVVGAGWMFHNSVDHIINGINVVRNVILSVFGLILLFSLYKYIRNHAFGSHHITKE